MNKEEIAKSIDEGLKILKQEPSFIFNLEEIKAIDYLQLCYDISTIDNESLPKLGIVLNLISKLQKEVDKKDKVIDLMAKPIAGLQLYDFDRKEYFTLEDEREVREYFYKKVEEENDDINRNC